MSADTRPIPPARFAAALKDLSVGMLHLKVLEIRNSIAHLQYSNDQLRPFAEGSAVAASSTAEPTPAWQDDGPDQDCIDAIRENEQVIDRMLERVAIIRVEVEERGVSWTEFQSKEEVEARQEGAIVNELDEPLVNGVQGNGTTPTAAPHSAWSDGTFQTGTIRNGEVNTDGQAGGTLNDEQLRQALQERLRGLGLDDDAEGDDAEGDDGGMHL